jgi:lon-related putative ATP-dependent protease
MIVPDPLPVEKLFHACGDEDIAAASSSELEPIDGVVGQGRAVQALKFAVTMDIDGHNVFVLGPPGTGRRTFVRRALTEAAAGRQTPSDWCYVNNFDEPQCPTALELPAGMGKRFAAQMAEFIDEVQTTLSAAFDGEDYRTRHQAIEAEFQEQQSAAVGGVHEEAKNRGIRIMQTPSGVIFAPIRDGEAVGPEEFEKLPEDEQKRIQKDVEEIGKKLHLAMEETPQRIRKMREQIAELDNQVMSFSVGSLIKDLIAAYAEFPRVVEFLKSLELDLIKNSALIRHEPDKQMPFPQAMPEDATKRRYAVNVIVSRGPESAAPVVIEERPAYAHLIGRMEHRAQMGTLTTDFTLIRGGALHRANGGYLVLDARRLLTEPFAWDGLKQALKSERIKIESIAEAYALSTTIALEPEPIPLKVKVVLIGDRRLYFLLQAHDPEFTDLFKVAADFDDRMDRTADSQQKFARVMAAIVERNSLLPLTRGAMYRAIEESVRDAGDHEKLSTEIRRTEDLLREGHYWARDNGRSEITAADIDAAIESREDRHGRIRERVAEEITRGNILIDTEGEKIGQINGLAVHQMGEYSFGRPSRITARVSLGTGKVIDIERESDLGGSLHSKGILILSGFIAANYVVDQPLSLAATIAFEQSYGGIDGDSASSTELYALLSAIANVPLSQSFAVTGSVNQYGEVQAIGGVNEKIEGFFDICEQRGLTGDQGVLIPASNVKHLMLRRRVTDAVADGKFRIFAVARIDEGLSILTGLPAGTPDTDGKYPSGTLNCMIREALAAMADRRHDYANRGKENDKP